MTILTGSVARPRPINGTASTTDDEGRVTNLDLKWNGLSGADT